MLVWSFEWVGPQLKFRRNLFGLEVEEWASLASLLAQLYPYKLVRCQNLDPQRKWYLHCMFVGAKSLSVQHAKVLLWIFAQGRLNMCCTIQKRTSNSMLSLTWCVMWKKMQRVMHLFFICPFVLCVGPISFVRTLPWGCGLRGTKRYFMGVPLPWIVLGSCYNFHFFLMHLSDAFCNHDLMQILANWHPWT